MGTIRGPWTIFFSLVCTAQVIFPTGTSVSLSLIKNNTLYRELINHTTWESAGILVLYHKAIRGSVTYTRSRPRSLLIIPVLIGHGGTWYLWRETHN